MEAPPAPPAGESRTSEAGRAERLARRRGWKRRILITATVVVLVVGVSGLGYAVLRSTTTTSSAAPNTPVATNPPTSAPAATTTTAPPTTTTTTPLLQPKAVAMPSPGNGLSWGSRGPMVALYQTRLKQLHFDPGPINGVFGQDTQYAVVTVQKYYGLPRTGVINAGVQAALSTFKYSPAETNAEPDRVEIDLDRQVLTLFAKGQPALLTTTSTGSGEHFCGGVDGCQYAITPAGHYHFYSLHKGWQKGKLGTMWNPYYFNGSDAVHGLQSVPPYPASHGCARIPMHIADYFYLLVHQGESVFVVGTPKKAGNGYIGPAPVVNTTTTTPASTTTVSKSTVPTTTPTTVKKPTTTTVHTPPTTTTPTT